MNVDDNDDSNQTLHTENDEIENTGSEYEEIEVTEIVDDLKSSRNAIR